MFGPNSGKRLSFEDDRREPLGSAHGHLVREDINEFRRSMCRCILVGKDCTQERLELLSFIEQTYLRGDFGNNDISGKVLDVPETVNLVYRYQL